MPDASHFLQNLALVLCVAAVTTVVLQRLRQPVVFGYLLAGMIVGPHVPIPLGADLEMVRVLSELGVILLMFALGLDFNLRKLIELGPTAGIIAIAETSIMLWLGYSLGQAFGWTRLESFYAGAVIAISSTTIIAKAFEEQRVRGRFTEVVIGILIIEDLIAVLLLAMLTTIAAGVDVTPRALATTGIRLATFLALLVVVGLLFVPRLVRTVVRMRQSETILVVSIGICFAAALAAREFGYSVALGAFIAGSLVAESGEVPAIEPLVRPVRDVFVAIFFVSVGMMIDPALIAGHWIAVSVFVLAVIVGKVGAVSISSFLIGHSSRTSVQAGMSLAQIGEFSFIIAAVGLASGGTREFLYPVAVAVSAITTLTTPWLIRAAPAGAAWVDRKLPRPLQTYAALYGAWIEDIRAAGAFVRGRSRERRMVGLLLLDAIMLALLVVGTALEMNRVTAILTSRTALTPMMARAVVVSGALVVGAALLYGLLRTARMLGLSLALQALPRAPHGKVDIAAAPRRALVVTLQLGIAMAILVPLLALTQPFLPPLRLALVIGVLAVALLIAFWRSAANLQGHARAGAQVIAAALAKQMSAGPEALQRTMEQVHSVLPGLGEPVPLRVKADSAAVNHSLADLNLRGRTGATVLAITRAGEQVAAPAGQEVLRAGDVLALAGTAEAIDAARTVVETTGPDAVPAGPVS